MFIIIIIIYIYCMHICGGGGGILVYITDTGMDQGVDNNTISEVQAEFVTHISDSKYHLNDKNLYVLPTNMTSDDLNEVLY